MRVRKCSKQFVMLIATMLSILFMGTIVLAEETTTDLDDECYTMGGGYISEETQLYGASLEEETALYADDKYFESTGFDGKTYYHENRFSDTTVRRGIDVSKWQKDIDWNKVKASGVDYAIIRVAFRSAKEGKLGEDEYGIKNLIGAKQAGLKVGVYIFSEAITVQEAEEEADYVLNLIDGRFLDLPIVFDYEDGYYVEANIKYPGRFKQANVSKELGTQMCNAFCNRVKSRGYTAMVYANVSTLTGRLIPEQIYNTNYIWVARYNDRVSTSSWAYNGKYSFWQYSESLSIDGINSSSVDGDFWYDDGLSMALNRTGLFYQGNDLYYFKNGHIDYSYNGVAKCRNKWYYVKNGKADLSYTGLASNSNGWWYCQKGIVDFKYNGLCANQYGTWYVYNGMVQTNYTGVPYISNTSINGQNGKATTYKGWYSIVNGKLIYTEDILKNSNGWWYVNNGMVDFNANSIYKNNNGWWYVKDGKVDFNYSGIARNKYGDWYIKGGKVQMDTTGVVYSANKKQGEEVFDGWYYVEDGKVVYNRNTIGKNNSGSWYIGTNGKVDFTVDTVAKTDCGWWYVRKGKIDEAYTGIARNTNGDWYLKDGKVQFDVDDILKSNTIDHDIEFNGWYLIRGGKVQYDTITVAKNKNGWWYVKDGKVDFEANTVAKNENGWWRIKDGKVDFNYTGVASNENGDWYIKDGKVDFSYNGIAKSGQDEYLINGGSVRTDVTDLVKLTKSECDGIVYEGWYNIVEGKILRQTTLAQNENGIWYVKDGKVDFTYSGEFELDGHKYKIVKGKVQ